MSKTLIVIMGSAPSAKTHHVTQRGRQIARAFEAGMSKLDLTNDGVRIPPLPGSSPCAEYDPAGISATSTSRARCG